MMRGNGALAAASRVVSPRRTTAFVALAAVAALAASQFVNYRAIEIGARAYSGLAGVAPPPQVAAETPRDAHGDWVLVICAAALAIILAAGYLRRPALARFLILLGGAAIAIGLAGDRPRALDVGQTGVEFQGARAVLLGGFGGEIAAAGALAFAGFTLPLMPRRVAG